MEEIPSRGRRRLTAEELALWQEATRSVVTRRRRQREDKPQSRVRAPEREAKAPPLNLPSLAAQPAAVKPRLAAISPLEPRLQRRLAKGRSEIDAVLDLHGSTQAEAHRRLVDFLMRNQSVGSKLVLIVTGKGHGDAQSGETGVLRRAAPLWLRAPALRPFVLSVQEAAAIHGGSGALYVRLRRGRSRRS
jgi:DNA-nicking Smr family endonuclease